MKRLLLLITLLLSCGLTFSQITQKRFDASMRDASEMMNEIAPIPMSEDMGFLDHFSYKNKVLTIDVRTSEGKLYYAQMRSNESAVVKIYAVAVRVMLEALWEVALEEVDKLSYIHLYDYFDGVRMIFVEENTHKGYDLFIPSSEIRTAKQVNLDLYSDDGQTFKDSLMQVMQEDGSEETLKIQFEEFSKQNCPMEVSAGIYIDAIKYENKSLKYVFRLPLNYAGIDSVAMRQNIFDRIANPLNGSTLDLLEYMKQLGAGLAFEMHFQDETVVWSFSSEELARLNQDGIADAETVRARLEQSCADINSQTPIMLDEITRLDSAMLEGNNYVYCYTILADFPVDFDSKDVINGIHTNNHLSLYDADLLLVNFMEQLMAADMNLIFRYVNVNDGKVISDTYTKQDLQDIIDSKKDE